MRVFVNKPGVVFDAGKTTVIFAEDMNEIVEAIQSIMNGEVPGIGGFDPVVSDTEPTSPNEGDSWIDTSVDLGVPVRSSDIQSVVQLTQAEYDALGTYDSTTLYYIVG